MANPSGSSPGRTPSASVALLGIAGCWCVFLIASVSAGHARVGFPAGRLLLGTVAFGGGLLLLIVFARNRRDGRLDVASRTAGEEAKGQPARPGRLIALSALIAVIAVFLAVLTTAAHDSASRSSKVQHHGLREHGTVLSVQETTRTDYSKSYGYRTRVTASVVKVRLDEELQGREQTTVRTSGAVAFRKGAGIEVLVDPQDVGHAELPGHTTNPSGAWVLLLSVALLAWVGLVAAIVSGPRRQERLR